MATHESLRNVLQQVHSASRERIDAGDVSGEELDALTCFADDVGKLVAKLGAQDPAIPKRNLFQNLMELHGRCLGPLEQFRVRIEEALSVVETLTQ